MSETQGSHRRVSWPGTEPDAGTAPATDLALDPELDFAPDPLPDAAPAFDPAGYPAAGPEFDHHHDLDSDLDSDLDLASALGLVSEPGPDAGVPAPRGEGRRGSRRRAAPAGPAPGTTARPTGRRRAADPVHSRRVRPSRVSSRGRP
ncbi:hypothetical protein [Streptomyces sp. NPDC057939]|uniref:hypothetical protein n=1 Tax=Streptomyces sp. NPDC057939 TaxID=3346284 RepID=UPI0036E23F7A